MTSEEALRHEWVLDGLPPQILMNHQKLHNIPSHALPTNTKKKLDRFLRKAKQEEKKAKSCKSNSTHKDLSISKTSSLNNSQTRKKKAKPFELVGFSPKSNGGTAHTKYSKEARKSVIKGKKKLKVAKKRKNRFIGRLGARKIPNEDTATNQTLPQNIYKSESDVSL
jgi:hypothetical protein